MFMCLFEKAYVKMNVCYEFIKGGQSYNAIIDLTGGLHEIFDIKKLTNPNDQENYSNPNILWERFFHSIRHNSFFCCSASENEAKNQGIVLSHAYSILNCFEIIYQNGSFSALRLLNQQESSGQSIKLL